MNNSKNPTLFLLLLSLIYLSLVISFGRQEATDELYFKIAGLNLTKNGIFNAPELINFAEGVAISVSEVYFFYMPLYSFLFGIFVFFFKFGWQQVVIYDALIHLSLVWTIYLCTKHLSIHTNSTTPKWLLIVPAIAILPIGQVGRPDELAMIFGYLGILCVVRPILKNSNLYLCGASLALCALTSTATAIELGIIIFFTIIYKETSNLNKFKQLLIVGITSFLLLIIGLLPILLKYPGAHEQYLQIAKLFKPSLSNLFNYKNIFKYGSNYIAIIVSSLIIYIAYILSNSSNKNTAQLHALWLGSIVSIIFVLLIFPIKYTYLWFPIPMLMILSILTVNLIRKRNLYLFYPSIFVLIISTPLIYASSLQHNIIQLTLERNQTIRFNQKFITETIPKGSTVITQRGWWYLAGENYTLRDSMFSNDKSLDKIDYIILTGNGSGKPGVPHFPGNNAYKKLLLTEFSEIANNLKQERNQLFTIPLSNSGNGHGVIIYKRKNNTQ